MQIVLTVIKCMFILLGLITVLIGKYLSPNYILRNAKRHISNERKYILGNRILLFSLGLYYIVWGIFLLFIHGWPMAVTTFSTFIPAIIAVIISFYWRKKSTCTC